MGIKMTTGMGDIDAYLEKQIERQIQAVILNLDYIGSTCVTEARTNRTYTPRTEALLNSTGYAVIRDGEIVSGGGLKDNGATAGQSAISELIAKHPKGIWLIVVAGMNYAAYVEAKNFNVLSSAELLAEQLVPKMLKDLGFTKK
jgi:hypothetical protein